MTHSPERTPEVETVLRELDQIPPELVEAYGRVIDRMMESFRAREFDGLDERCKAVASKSGDQSHDTQS